MAGSTPEQMDALRLIFSAKCAERRQHGTRAMYRTGGCRCDDCREAEAAAMRASRRSRGIGGMVPMAVVPDDTDWMRQGNCRGADPNIFFPEATGGRPRPTLYDRARVLCDACPVREPCLAHGVKHEKEGMWGGKSPVERAAMRRQHVEGCGCNQCRKDPADKHPVDPEKVRTGERQEWCRQNQTSFRWGCRCRSCRASVVWKRKSAAKPPAQHKQGCSCPACTAARGGGRYASPSSA